jgi:aryl-alcohol dehydrogenase-like predicted oxidoreductase
MKAGKVRYIGASNHSGSRLAEALETSRRNNLASYVSLQPHYNLVEREKFETDLLPVVQKYQLGVIPYFSLAAGFLSGKYRSKQDAEKAARGAMVQKYLNDSGFGVIAALNEVANSKGSTPARVALAWLIAQPGVHGRFGTVSCPHAFRSAHGRRFRRRRVCSCVSSTRNRPPHLRGCRGSFSV